MASTVKVAVAALYLAQVDHGRRSLDDTINGVSARSLMKRMLVHSDNRATDILLKDLGGPTRASRLAAAERGQRASRRPHDRAAAVGQARPVGPPRFEHADGDGRPAPPDLSGRADQAAEPQLSARPDGAVRNRQEPDEGAASGRSDRAQDRHPQRPHRRRRVHHHARRASRCGGDLHARRQRPAAHHRRRRRARSTTDSRRH